LPRSQVRRDLRATACHSSLASCAGASDRLRSTAMA
jgi:hypothetical protein